MLITSSVQRHISLAISFCRQPGSQALQVILNHSFIDGPSVTANTELLGWLCVENKASWYFSPMVHYMSIQP